MALVMPMVYLNIANAQNHPDCSTPSVELNVTNTRTHQTTVNTSPDDVRTGDVLSVFFDSWTPPGQGNPEDTTISQISMTGDGGTFDRAEPTYHSIIGGGGSNHETISVNYTVGSLPDTIYAHSVGSCSASYSVDGNGQIDLSGGSSSGAVTRTGVSNLAVYSQPQLSLLVNGQTSASVLAGSTPSLSWSTNSVNPGNSCEAANTNSDSLWNGSKNGPSGGTQTTSPLNSSGVFTYSLYCHGFGVDSIMASVQIIVGSAVGFTCSIDSPQSITVIRGSDAAAVMQVHPLNGFAENVNFTGQVTPRGRNSPTIISPYANNPQNSPYSSATAAVLHTTSTTTISTFQVIFTGTSLATGLVVSCPAITLTVNPIDVDPPDNVQVNTTAGCGTATVTWNRPATGPTPESYQVYRSTRSLPTTFIPVGSTVSDTGTGPYSLTDSSPLSLTGTNYYGVKSILGTQYSTLAISNPVIPEACAPSLNLSNKDLVRVDNNTQTPPNPCNDNSDVFILPSKAVFKTGSKVYFNINVCNSGTRKLTGIQVTENDARNISDIQLVTRLGGCVLSGSGSGPYVLKDLDAPPTSGQFTVCTLQLSGTLNAPADDPEGFLYRFWNKATISSNELNPRTVITIPYLFSDTGKPTRNETAP